MNVLLLSDFSTPAQNAHKYAIHLLQNQEVNFFITHIKKACAKSSCGGSCKLGIHQNLLLQKKQLEDSTESLLHRFEIILQEGNLLETVRRMVELYDIDMIVMGAHGKSGKTGLKLGTYTKNLAIKVKCPVLIVFENSSLKLPTNINFPVDYTDKLQYKCITKFKRLPKWEKMSVDILELASHDTLIHQAIAKKVVTDSFVDVETNFIQTTSDLLDVAKTIKEKDLLLLAARNIGVCEQIFSYVEANYQDFQDAPPILVLHA